MEDINLKVFNVIKGLNESETLAENISCECIYEFDCSKVTQDKNWAIISLVWVQKINKIFRIWRP